MLEMDKPSHQGLIDAVLLDGMHLSLEVLLLLPTF